MGNKLSELHQLALQDDKEAKEEIEKRLPGVCNDPDVFEWACTAGMFERDYKLQGLAASVLEKADWPEGLGDSIDTHLLMLFQESKEPEPQYARFRMACAMYKHGRRNCGIVDALRAAPDDMKDIAEKYLAQE